MLPVLLLEPRPGEFVLDLCAAPGNKTAQIAVAMQNTGRVVANEINRNRMRPLRQIINRLGLMNVVVTQANARSFPKQVRQFDRVLADVHCSCEGTSRKNPAVLNKSTTSYSERIAASQRAILTRAVQLCKPGGRIVYSTCTYAPEENEMVVEGALVSLRPRIDTCIRACKIPGIRWSPGLESWEGQQFRADMVNAIRIYPHQNDTGGFFIAVIEKISDERRPLQKCRPPSESEALAECTASDADNVFVWLEKQFGLDPSIFQNTRLLQNNAKLIALQNVAAATDVRPAAMMAGLPLVHSKMKEPKLTTAGAMAFGSSATKQIVNAEEAQMQAFLAGTDFRLSRNQSIASLRRGSVLIQFQEMFLGVGFFVPGCRGGTVTSQFPKAWQQMDGS